MSDHRYAMFQGLITAGLGFWLLLRVWDGTILFYINQRFVLLVLLAALGLLLLAQMVFRQLAQRRQSLLTGEVQPPHAHAGAEEHDHTHDHDHDHGTRQASHLMWVALPLVLGLLFSPKPLDASAVANRGISTSAAVSRTASGGIVLGIPPEERTVLDWLYAAEDSPNPAELDGLPAVVTGFVVREAGMPADQFLIGRFTITCCVADSAAIGLPVIWPEAEELADQGWVQVRGTVKMVQEGGRWQVQIAAEQVEEAPQPEQPYLFP